MKVDEIILKGYSICRGVAIGKPIFFHHSDLVVSEKNIATAHVQQEINRYRKALAKSKYDIKCLQQELEGESLGEGFMILESQLEILDDPLLTVDIEKEIHKNKKNAAYVFQQAILKYQERFEAIKDPFFVEKFKDLQDLSRRIFSNLHENAIFSWQDLPPSSVICMHELTASDAASANNKHVAAFIIESGGVTMHAAIVARAKGIPCITNINLQLLREKSDQALIVDGRSGKLILNPAPQTVHEYTNLQGRLQQQLHLFADVMRWPAETIDGYKVRLSANLDMEHEIALIKKLGAAGIGLFRSEYIFLPQDKMPTEEEQFQAYLHVVHKMQDLPIVIRTFDLGGDKTWSPQLFYNEGHPFMGCRAMRFLLKQRQLLKEQIRAILRASLYGNVSILFPMISTVNELREAKHIVQEAAQELQIDNKVRIGCMIEIPSAVMLIDHFVAECDFLSIGTNDLAQYTLAVDRGEQDLEEFYECIDPSVIRFIKLVSTAANLASKPVSLCGEMASDPRFTALLIGLGIVELSVSPHHLPLIKNAIRNVNLVDAIYLAEKALRLATGQEMLKLIGEHYQKHVPEDLFYNVLN